MAMGDHNVHNDDLTWAEYTELVEEYGEDFLNEYKDVIFFITDVSSSDIINILINRVAALQSKYDRLVAAYKQDHPEFDEETGRLTWDVTIDASEQKTIEYSYRVTYPKGKTISYEEEYRGRW